MLRALTANLVAHERIETTDAKAKELRRVAERLITKAVRLGPVAYTPQSDLGAGDRAKRLSAERRIGRFLRRFAVVERGGELRRVDLIEKVFLDLAKRFRERPGGYTRIVKLGRRRGDNAPMALIELVELGGGAVPAADEDKPKKAEKAAALTEKRAKKAEADERPADKPAGDKRAKKTSKKSDGEDG